MQGRNTLQFHQLVGNGMCPSNLSQNSFSIVQKKRNSVSLTLMSNHANYSWACRVVL